jgi:hypothetical protein
MAIGDSALNHQTYGCCNVAIGPQALFNNTTGGGNTAIGATDIGVSGALGRNTTGSDNTAVGLFALNQNTTGSNNTAVGAYSFWSTPVTNGLNGSNNTGIGAFTLDNVAGSSNIAVGYQAGQNIIGSNNIDIGNSGLANDSGAIRIGTSSAQSTFFAAGIRGVTTLNNDAVPVVIDSNGQLGTVSSSRRYKQDIEDMDSASDGLLQLRPVTFRYTKPYSDGSKPIDYGLIAEEVAEIYPDLVVRGADGQVETVQYQKLTPMLLNEVQKQHATIRALEQRLATIEAALQASGLSGTEIHPADTAQGKR